MCANKRKVQRERTSYLGGKVNFMLDSPQRKTIGGFFGIGATSFLEFEVKTL